MCGLDPVGGGFIEKARVSVPITPLHIFTQVFVVHVLKWSSPGGMVSSSLGHSPGQFDFGFESAFAPEHTAGLRAAQEVSSGPLPRLSWCGCMLNQCLHSLPVVLSPMNFV